jgi:hypothetical protein
MNRQAFSICSLKTNRQGSATMATETSKTYDEARIRQLRDDRHPEITTPQRRNP